MLFFVCLYIYMYTYKQMKNMTVQINGGNIEMKYLNAPQILRYTYIFCFVIFIPVRETRPGTVLQKCTCEQEQAWKRIW
jgi:hypothetical protein